MFTITALSEHLGVQHGTTQFSIEAKDPCGSTTFTINPDIFSAFPLICNVGFPKTVEDLEDGYTYNYVTQTNSHFVGALAALEGTCGTTFEYEGLFADGTNIDQTGTTTLKFDGSVIPNVFEVES